MNLTYCGPIFSPAELERIRACTAFDGRKPDGGLKTMPCKVALRRLHRDGHITLLPPRGAPRQIRPTRNPATTSHNPSPAPDGPWVQSRSVPSATPPTRTSGTA